jgi:hypothetical protein
MKRNCSTVLVLILTLAVVLPAFLSAQNPAPKIVIKQKPGEPAVQPTAPQAAPAKAAAKVKAPPVPEIIHPAYASLKEKTAVLVFLAWLWLIVGILVWLLRMKIREADRVYGLKFYPAPKDAPRPPSH